MADFQLTVGAEIETSKQQMLTDIQTILSEVSGSNDLKVKIGLEIDNNTVTNLQKQIDSLYKTINSDGSGKKNSGVKGFSKEFTDAKKAAEDYYRYLKKLQSVTNVISINKDTGVNTKALPKEMQNNYKVLIDTFEKVQNEYLKTKNVLNSSTGKVSDSEISKFNQFDSKKMDDFLVNLEKAQNSTTKFNNTPINIDTADGQKALREVDSLITKCTLNQEKFTAARYGKGSKEYSSYQTIIDEANALHEQLNKGTISQEGYNQAIAKLSTQEKTATNSLKNMGKATKSLSDRVGGLAQKFTTWFGLTRIIMAAYRALKQMVGAVIEVDTAMTELKKVTDASDATYERFLVNASKRAKELGASLTDIVNASANFARLGYSIEDSEKLADTAIIYKNVGDGIENINQASESIIATMQAFGISAEDAMGIVDKFNAVGNNYAISSKGVGDALLRSAAAMHSANNTLDETIALSAAANTIVQDPEKVGTTLKTVSMYLRAAKTEAEDAGESTEGMAESVSKLREDLLALTGGKVDIQLNEDEFKSTYQILQELSQVWDDVSDVSQANILEMVGGKRNANVVSAILENFSVASEAVSTSANSAGSAIAENEKYLDSIQGKITTFKATFEELSTSLIDSEFVKGVVEVGTLLLTGLNSIAKIIDAIGGLNTLLTATLGIMLSIHGVNLFSSVQTAIKGAIESVTLFIMYLKEMYAANIVAGMNGLTAGVKAFGGALKAAGVASPWMLALTAALIVIPKIVDACTTSTEEWREKLAESKQELADLKSESETLNSELETTQDRIDELLSKGSLSIVEQDELERLRAENAELERQITLNNIAQRQKNKENNKNFVETMQSDLIDEDSYGIDYTADPEGRVVYGMSGHPATEKDYINQMFKDYKEAQDELSQLEQDYIDKKISKKEYESQKKTIDEQIETILTYLDDKQSDFNETAKDIEYIPNPTNEDEEKTNEWLNYINEFNDKYILALGTTEEVTQFWDNLLDKPQFSKARDELQELANAGELTAESLANLISENDNVAELVSHLSELGLIDLSTINNQLARQFKLLGHGDVDLANRPRVDFNEKNFGAWKEYDEEIINDPNSSPQSKKWAREDAAAIEQGDSVATVYSSSYSSEDGAKQIVLTPILPNGKVLSPDELQTYADQILSGNTIEVPNGITLGVFDKKDNENFDDFNKRVEDFCNNLHFAQEAVATIDINKDGILGLDELQNADPQALSYLLNGLVNGFNDVSDGADEASESVDNLSDAFDTLDSYSEAFSALGDAFNEVSKDGKVTYSTLSDIQEKFAGVDGMDKYISQLAAVQGDTEKTNDVLGKMANAYVKLKLGAENLVDADKKVVAAMLEEAGIANANQYACYMIADAKAKAAIANEDFTKATWEEITSLYNEAGQTDLTTRKIYEYLYYKQLANANSLDTTKSVNQLSNLAKAAGITGQKLTDIIALQQIYNNIAGADGTLGTEDDKQATMYELNQIDTLKARIQANAYTDNTKFETGDISEDLTDGIAPEFKDKDDKDKNKDDDKSPQEKALEKFQNWFGKLFDWIEIKLERQTDKISRYIENAENLTDSGNYDSAASNYRKGIQATTTQIKYQFDAGNRYHKTADSVLSKAVSTKTINQKQARQIEKLVKNGKIDIESYNDSVKEVITSYQEWYNKSREAKRAIQELHTNIRTYIQDLKDLRDAQRDAKIEKIDTRTELITSGFASESNRDASTENQRLTFENSQLDKTTKAYSDTTSKNQKDSTKLGNKAITNINKVVKSKQAKKNKKYKIALKNAKKAIKSGKEVSKSDLKIIKDNNLKIYEKIYAYNLSLDNVETARLEEAVVIATNNAEKYENTAKKYENIDNATQNKIDLNLSKAKNATSYKTKNKFINQAINNYDKLNQDNQKEIKDYENDITTESGIISKKNKHHKGSNFKSLSKKGKKSVNSIIDKAQSYVASGKIIPDNIIDKLAEYYSQGYITKEFYEACINYNLAVEHKAEAEAQAEIDAETIKQEKAALGQEKVDNIAQSYDNTLRESNQKVTVANNANTLKTTKGIALTESDYSTLLTEAANQAAINKQAAADIVAQANKNVQDGLWSLDSQEYKDAIAQANEYSNAADQAAIEQEELNNQIINLPYEQYDKLIEKLEAIDGLMSSINDLTQAQGYDLTKEDYQTEIDENQNQIYALEGEQTQAYNDWQLALADPNKVYGGKTADEWEAYYNTIGTKINNLKIENEQLKDELRDDVYWRDYERAVAATERWLNLLSGIGDLISDEFVFDKDGNFTDLGIAKVATLIKGFEQSKVLVSDYIDSLNNLNQLYADGEYTEQEYLEKRGEIYSKILTSASSVQSYLNGVIDLYKQQAQAELDLLYEVIDARTEALNKKKEYYDYDKNIRSQTKEIKSLQAQLAALEGISTAAAKAKKAQLEADLSEKQEELDDTVNEHLLELSQESLENLKETLQDSFDDYWDEINKNIDSQLSFLELINCSVEDVDSTLQTFLSKLGIDTGAGSAITGGAGLGSVTGYASGTKRVPKDMIALTQENGAEMIITKHGVLTPLEQGDGVIPAELTSRLYDMAMNGETSKIVNMKPEINLPVIEIPSIEVNQEYDSLIRIEGSADAATVEDLKKYSKDFLEKSYKYTTNKMYKGYIHSGGKRKI